MKLSKPQRREQLLDIAVEIARSEGTDGLTLARLAEMAGVSKPIAYEHFTTREGLLLALFQRFDDKTATRVAADMAARPASLDKVVSIIATAYVSCFVSAGPAFAAILDSLSGNAETGSFRRKWREELATAILALIAPYCGGSRPVIIGLLGAAETLSETAAYGLMSEKQAVAALTKIMVSALQSQKDS